MIKFASLAIPFHKGWLDIGKPAGVLYDIKPLKPVLIIKNNLLIHGLYVEFYFLKRFLEVLHGLSINPLDELIYFWYLL